MVATRRRVRTYGSFRGISAKAITDLDVVIIDVLRATTTIAYALSRGARVRPVADEAAARTYAGANTLLVGEHLGHELPGFDCNNSSSELAAHDLAHKTLVLATTNGTKAVIACAPAHRIFAGALTNAPAVARYLAASSTRDIALVCAGRATGALAFEDMLGAGAIADALVTHAPALWLADGTRIAYELFARHRDDLHAAVRNSDAARDLLEQGNAADVDIASSYAAHDSVPLLQGGMFVVAS